MSAWTCSDCGALIGEDSTRALVHTGPHVDDHPARYCGIPRADEFGSDEVIYRVAADARPDDFNRTPFTVFWLSDDPMKPGGVAGQVFFADLDAKVAAESRPARVERGAA